MTVHKLSTGDGYTYLTRQVASADELRPAGQSLADYYAAVGNPPGRWVGAGAADLCLAGEVSEAQMRALFGRGMHPDVERIVAALLAAGASAEEARRSARLGRPFPEVVSPAPPRRPVAGYDLVFTPVKSASVLWALGDTATRAAVEAAHREAVADVLRFLEEHAAFTRVGANGVAQVDTHGLVAAAFEHRDSRLGDPDLHTHVAVSNKVRARQDGPGGKERWLALDGRALYAVGVAASERNNTRFEDALARRLRVRFVDRADTVGRDRRTVREIAGIPDALIRHFSQRRSQIESRYRDLLGDYRARHGHEPPRAAQIALAQQATLDTRQAKKSPRSLADQLAGWRQQAATVTGRAAPDIAAGALRGQSPYVDPAGVDVDGFARTVLTTVEQERSTWSRWNLLAEAERALRPLRFADPADRDRVTAQVVDRATDPQLSVRLSAPALVQEPAQLRRIDGQSVFRPHGAERWTTERTLSAEADLVAAGRERTGRAVDPALVGLVVSDAERRTGRHLDPGQAGLVREFTTGDALLAVAVGPAGAGKTTALRTACAVWDAAGVRVVPLATSAKAAEVLATELGRRAENLHKFVHELDLAPRADGDGDGFFRLGPGEVVLVDEAGMAGTHRLARLLFHVRASGALLRLVGDPRQLDAVESGGALRLLARDVGALQLGTLHRFLDPTEAAATLRLRTGDPAGLAFYESNDRIRAGTKEAMLDAAFAGWRTDAVAGRFTLMAAADAADVAELSSRARLDRIALGAVEPDGVLLADGNHAGRGDWVVTRTNDRRLITGSGRAFVKNGDVWTVTARHADGSLTVAHAQHRGAVRLPGAYVAASTELAYAVTAHRAQGMTVDTAHPVVTPGMSRESLYVLATRARTRTTLYVASDELVDVAVEHAPPQPRTARQVLEDVLATEAGQRSATETLRDTLAEAQALPALVAAYEHAVNHAISAAYEPVAQRALGAGLAAEVVSDPAWPSLAGALCDAEHAGHPAGAMLRGAAAVCGLDGVRSAAGVLAWRIRSWTTDAAPRAVPADDATGLPPWVTPPGLVAGRLSPEWAGYLRDRADLITDRVAYLADRLAEQAFSPDRPPWAAALGPVPDEPVARDGWRRAAALVAAYREQYGVTTDDPLFPLGRTPEPDNRQGVAWQAARAALIKTARSATPAVAPIAHRPATPPPRPAYPQRPPQYRF